MRDRRSDDGSRENTRRFSDVFKMRRRMELERLFENDREKMAIFFTIIGEKKLATRTNVCGSRVQQDSYGNFEKNPPGRFPRERVNRVLKNGVISRR